MDETATASFALFISHLSDDIGFTHVSIPPTGSLGGELAFSGLPSPPPLVQGQNSRKLKNYGFMGSSPPPLHEWEILNFQVPESPSNIRRCRLKVPDVSI